MQGQPELGGAPGQVLPPSGSLSDLAEGAGEVSLHQASKDSGAGETPGAQSGDDVEWPILNYENIFRFAFQEVPVQQTTEDVSTLDLFLEISSEEKPGLGSVHKLCSESRKLWRALQNTDTTLTSQCLWSESRCQENYFLVLGIDAAQKAPARGQANKHPSVPGPQPEVKEVPQQNAVSTPPARRAGPWGSCAGWRSRPGYGRGRSVLCLGATGRICTTGADGGGGCGGRGLQRAQGRAGGSGMDTVNMGATEQGVQVEAWHQPQGGSLRPRPEATAHKSHWVHWSHTNLHRVRLMGYQRKCKLEWGLPSSNRVGKDLFPFLKALWKFSNMKNSKGVADKPR
ncbi:uncharacterized protein CLBA1 isoform X4 [Equus przewalskii]|uniref:Uncharacterized protein CLBA1 isoform X4 n=1 Tax=Equus przewalskii TaxID=9798 RepID=A0ABM4MC47_EQUPR